VFVVATCNDISRLPPEFSRAERWDAIFFLDLPGPAERSLIWQQYAKAFGVNEGVGTQDWDDGRWTGAEIKACCRLARLLSVPLREAASFVVPVASTAAGKVQQLREWASGRCLDATRGGMYRHDAGEKHGKPARQRRSIAAGV
jgi:SpoVK/Ycf46/Vps4 family AAA+-type ATPase